MLVVIAILGILAGLAVPALKNMGNAKVQVSAARQLLDDVGRARQLAISGHTTVYMVFVQDEYWYSISNSLWNSPITTSLLDKQFTGYNFLSMRNIGDQPGQGIPHYHSSWKSLPDGTFIATNKFNDIYSTVPYTITDSIAGVSYPIRSFCTNTPLRFPTETNSSVVVPYIAFNYLGQLTRDSSGIMSTNDEYIPLAQGYVSYAMDQNKNLQLLAPSVAENPPGNSTNSMYCVIWIDRFTGRARQLQQKIK